MAEDIKPVAWLYYDGRKSDLPNASSQLYRSTLLTFGRQAHCANETPLFTAAQLAQAVAAEREACAKTCEEHPDGMNMLGGHFVSCAEAIRARKGESNER